jgi:toxin FitB
LILLDTNVLSELARPNPDGAVLRWAATVPVKRLCTTAITEAELRFGLALVPPGRRHADLAATLEDVFQKVVCGRVLPFDRSAARACAGIAAARRRAGRPVNTADLQIAAIAQARGVENLVTRNMADFEGCGVPCSTRGNRRSSLSAPHPGQLRRPPPVQGGRFRQNRHPPCNWTLVRPPPCGSRSPARSLPDSRKQAARTI